MLFAACSGLPNNCAEAMPDEWTKKGVYLQIQDRPLKVDTRLSAEDPAQDFPEHLVVCRDGIHKQFNQCRTDCAAMFRQRLDCEGIGIRAWSSEINDFTCTSLMLSLPFLR